MKRGKKYTYVQAATYDDALTVVYESKYISR